MNIAFFDLDHTLLNGDTDVLWVEYLVNHQLVDAAALTMRNQSIARQYKEGLIDPRTFTEFYVGTLRGRTMEEWEPIRQRFYDTCIAPRIGTAAKALVAHHRDAGHQLVLTSATNTYLTTLTAKGLGIDTLLGSEPQIVEGQFTGSTVGVLNMKEGKVKNIISWLETFNLQLSSINSYAYSDSINDLPLLEAVNHPYAVHPDEKLQLIARTRGWPLITLWEA